MYTVRAGSSSRTSGGTIVNVASRINHPGYNANTFDNDISIIKLASPLSFTTSIQPIKLHDKGNTVPDRDPTVVSG